MNHHHLLPPDLFPLPPPHHQPHQHHPETDTIIRSHLEKAHNKLRPVSSSGCLPHDIGLFLSQSVQLLDLLADGLVEGKHMKANTRVAIQQLESENDLSEIESLDGLIETHAIVRKIRERIHNATVEIQLLWDEVPPPPLPSNNLPIGVERPSVDTGSNSSINHQTSAPIPLYSPPQDDLPFPTFPAPPETSNDATPQRSTSGHPHPQPHLHPQPQAPIQGTNDGDAPSSDRETPVDPLEQLLDNLKSRGSGTYTCPHGLSCRKGAVGEDGELVVFTRNSEFRAHVEKHVKRYKCTLPHCPTRKGFSRPDQLRRHQESVPHVPQ